MSAATGPNPFARTSGVTQTADMTKSVRGFYGNIDFEKENALIEMRSTTAKMTN
jgi:hypothetical protein